MAKNKTEAAAKPASPAVVNGAQNGQKKKKKNDPLRPQPTWLYPNEEDNPVLNGKAKSDAEIEKETKERLGAINFLNHRSVTAPVKDAPDGLLLQLIGAFLTSYGFNSTSRIFTTERKARSSINGWKDQLGKKFDKGTPSLVQIFKRWEREWQLEQAEAKALKGDETSSDEAEDVSSDEDEKPAKKAKSSKKPSKDSDSSSSDSGSDSDDEAAPAKPSKKGATSTPAKKRKSDSGSESDSDASSSESDSDAPTKKRKVEEKGNGSKKVTTTKQANGVKAKETVKATPVKVEKTTVVTAPAASDESDDDSNSDSESSSESEAEAKSNGVAVTTNGTSTPNGKKAKKDASSDDDSDADSSSVSSSSSEDDAPAKTKEVDTPTQSSTTQKRKRSKSPTATSTPASTVKVAKKSNEPFSRIPKDQFVDPRLSSNKYVPYDYAQRAHEDLIVTKGKGFTKEKNKKKRGSYRGGAIDLGGGKGIKFDD